MSQNNAPIFVYQRRGHYNNSNAVHAIETSTGSKPSDDGNHSAVTSFFDRTTEAVKSLISRCDTRAISSFSNDNCSSSKSNMVPSHSGECSSLNVVSERDICISIIRNQGLLDKVWTRQGQDSAENSCISKDYYTSKPCKVCERFESTSNMLICDSCLYAFHMSCFNPCVTRVPVGEWLCGSCLNKKRKILNETSSGDSVNICMELGSVEFMLRDKEPYMSSVRVGDEFQAIVPDWSGPVYNQYGPSVDWLDEDLSNNISLQEWSSYTKPLKLSSIGNWLQCREFVQGSDEGTICGKWRRAPLLEVQNDDWECFCCVLWDPCHADCAAPQEVDTDEVMKQLKYMDMLRPRLRAAAKRRKLDCSQSV
ncbi:hypothetical protein ACP275_10G073500 [Erythranthe tilingii]